MPKDKDQLIEELKEDNHTLTQTIEVLNSQIDSLEESFHEATKCLEKIVDLTTQAINLLIRK